MKFRFISWIILASVLQLHTLTAHAVLPFGVTESELALMPTYCQAKYGKDRGNKEVNNHWRQIYGDHNWLNMHHYCDALKFIVRANRSMRNKADLRFYLEQAAQGIDSLLTTEQTPDWILRPEAHVKLGTLYLRLTRFGEGSEGRGVQNFEKAISIRPDYEPAYIALSDYYSDKGLKGKAFNIIEEGLRHSPDSKALLRRFKELGGKTPPPPVVASPSPAPDEVMTSPAMQTRPQPGGAASTLPPDKPATSTLQSPEQETMPEKIGSPTNPWCRFCPDPPAPKNDNH